MLRGKDVEDTYTQTRTVGHSHVLHPSWRDPKKAKEVMRRLILKGQIV